MIDGHGDDLFRFPPESVRVNFSTNIWQHADLEPLRRFMAGRLGFAASYPEPAPRSLEAFIAARLCVRPGEVIVSAGATDAIYSIAAAERRRPACLIGAPTFSEYADAWSVYADTPPTYTEAAPEALAAAPRGAIVWLCNPNNPTGTVVDPDALRALAAARPDALFVIDQAYAAYCARPLLTATDASALPNLIILHSLTKQSCVPGLRIGYASGAAPLLARIRAVRQPWSVGTLAADAARFLIDHPVAIPAGGLRAEASRIAAAMTGLGIESIPTSTNFLLARLPGALTAARLKADLMESDGLLIRDASNFHGLSPAHFRIAAQRPAENDLLIRALTRWISSHA